MEVKHYEVEFAPAVECLLQTPIFHDAERTDSLYEQADLLKPEELGMRREIGYAAIRLIAEFRSEARAGALRDDPNFDVRKWNAGWHLTTRMIGAVASWRKEEVRYLARQMALINMADEVLNDPDQMKEVTADLRGKQALYFEDALRSLRLAPRSLRLQTEDNSTATYDVRGTSVIAPTGYGKSKLMGKLAKVLGVGQPIRGISNDQDPVRLLAMVPTKELTDQLASVTGDKTFENTAGIRPGRYFSNEKNRQSRALAITMDMFLRDFKDGQLKPDEFDTGEDFDLLMIDETHKLTAENLLRHVLNHWQGHIFGFTATPSYDKEIHPRRSTLDVRDILGDVVDHDDMLSCIDDGLLNGAQLFTIVMSNELGEKVNRTEADDKVVEFLTPLLLEGRRGIVFCERGDKSESAVKLAEKLGKVSFPDGRLVKAKAIGSFDKESDKHIEAYHSGEINVLTSVQKGILGVNGAFDFVVFNRSFGSLLELKQAIGRGTRLSEEFPLTVYCQVFGVNEYDWQHHRDIYEVFELNEICQGATVGPDTEPRNRVKMEAYTKEFREMLGRVDGRTIGEVMLSQGAAVEVPEGYVLGDTIVANSGLEERYAYYKLLQAGFHWIGIRQKGVQKIVRYYEPAATEYFNFGSVGHTNKHGDFKRKYASSMAVSHEYGFGERLAKRIIMDAGVPLMKRKHLDTEATYFLRRDFLKIRSYIDENIPIAKPEEGSPETIAKELEELIEGKGLDVSVKGMIINTVHSRKMLSTYKRQPNVRGVRQFYSEEDTKALRSELREKLSQPVAPTGSMSVRHIMQVAELDPKNSNRYLTEEECQLARPRWIRNDKGKFMLLPTWTSEQSSKIISRLKSNEPTSKRRKSSKRT